MNAKMQLDLEDIKREYLTPSLMRYLDPTEFKMNKAMYNYLKKQEEFETCEKKLVILAYGGGQDSQAILSRLIFDLDFRDKYLPHGFESLLVLFANTSSEFDYTYTYIERVTRVLCEEYGIKFVSIDPHMGYHNPNWTSLREQWHHGTPSIGSLAYGRFSNCTHNLKLTPQYRYIEDYLENNYDIDAGTRKKNFTSFAKKYSEVTFLIGFSKNEEGRIFNVEAETLVWKKESIFTRYPLIDIGMTRTDCQEYIRSVGLEVPMPSHCIYCCYSSVGIELLFLYHNYPDKFYTWVEDEQRKLDAYKGATKKVLKYDGYRYDKIKGDNVMVNPRFEDEPIKNLGVVGKLHTKGEKKGQPFTLLDALEEAKEKYPNITLEEIREYKFSHGCTNSTY